ncbi:MAG: hypothetical protein LBH66_06260 [Oscillospiraceae bacterium]|jgi:hypothetical protein|nr:hypothetical protein [Oscillospiraceae bacterium]
MALTTGGAIQKSDYDAKKADAVTSLNTVGTTWTWVNTVAAGSLVTFNQIKELRDASDKAHDLIDYGCSAHNSAVNMVNS